MRMVAYLVLFSTLVVGGGSLILFVVFLLAGPLPAVTLGCSEHGRLAWDAMLSALFFLQHSAMVRRPVRSRLAALIPDGYDAAAYSIASGTVLALVVVLWQPSEVVYFELEGGLRWLPRVGALLAVAGFVWSVRSLGDLDAFGVRPLRLRIRGRRPAPPEFVVRGAYCYVRHPLYLSMLVLIWSTPRLSTDRLLLNLLWTAWIVVGTWLEERDLVRAFGDGYRDYQRRVPMLVPWRVTSARSP